MPGDLKKLISDTQDEFRKRPEKAHVSFHSSSALQDGFRSVASLREHLVTIDEPASLGGTDRGPNPVELILAALGSCQEITYRAYATALGIPLDSVSVDLTGDIDLRGFSRWIRWCGLATSVFAVPSGSAPAGNGGATAAASRDRERPLPSTRHSDESCPRFTRRYHWIVMP